jgi:cytochrome c oxidase assembly protein subunit 11
MSNPPLSSAPERLRVANRHMGRKLLWITVLMFGFGYALVPMYRAICSALGVNVLAVSELQSSGTGSTVAVNGQVDTSRTVTIEFDANARGPWDFKPEQRTVAVHPGAVTTVLYEFHNKQNRTMVAQAIPSYAPAQAMAHFNKLECFCFSEQTLAPGQSRVWPVVFVVDTKLPKDIKTITLSYTFFEVGGKTPPAPQSVARSALAAPAGGARS